MPAPRGPAVTSVPTLVCALLPAIRRPLSPETLKPPPKLLLPLTCKTPPPPTFTGPALRMTPLRARVGDQGAVFTPNTETGATAMVWEAPPKSKVVSITDGALGFELAAQMAPVINTVPEVSSGALFMPRLLREIPERVWE